MFSLIFGSPLGDFIAPRPSPQSEFSRLLRAGQFEECLRLLQISDNVIPLNDLDRSGAAPLHYASMAGPMELIMELLTQGAEINIIASNGNTVLHCAASKNRKNVVELLLRSGADPSIPNEVGHLPAELATAVDVKTLLIADRRVVIPGVSIPHSASQDRNAASIHELSGHISRMSINATSSACSTSTATAANATGRRIFASDSGINNLPVQHSNVMPPAFPTQPDIGGGGSGRYHANTNDDVYAHTHTSSDISVIGPPPTGPAASGGYYGSQSPDASPFTLRMGAALGINGIGSLDASPVQLNMYGSAHPDFSLGGDITGLQDSFHTGTEDFQHNEDEEEEYIRESRELRAEVLAAASETTTAMSRLEDDERRFAVVKLCQTFREADMKKWLEFDPSLAMCRANFGILGPDGQTPIHIAAGRNNLKALEYLLKAPGATAWVRDLQGRTPLHIAAAKGHDAVCAFLREKMREEKSRDPVGVYAPVDLAGLTPSGLAALSTKGAPSPAIKSALFSPGDKTVLPRTPHSKRAGKSPWKPTGTVEKEDALVYAFSEAQGWKPEMEDRVLVSFPVPGRPSWSFFGVCDGHGGYFSAEFLSQELSRFLVNEAASTDIKRLDEDLDETALRNLLSCVCLVADEALASQPRMAIEIKPKENSIECKDSSGSTAVLCLITRFHIAVANVGDSRAVFAQRVTPAPPSDPLVTSFQLHSPVAGSSSIPTVSNHADNGGSGGGGVGLVAIAMSEDHKFTILQERARAEAAGATVRRVGGPLLETIAEGGEEEEHGSSADTDADAVLLYDVGTVRYKNNGTRLRMSRSFGDFYLKQAEGLSRDQQAVIAVPDVVVRLREHNDAFIVLACDGIWDVLTNQEVVDFFGYQLGFTSYGGAPVGGVTTEQCAQACDALLQECLDRGAIDNLSVVVVVLNGVTTTTASASAATMTAAYHYPSSVAAAAGGGSAALPVAPSAPITFSAYKQQQQIAATAATAPPPVAGGGGVAGYERPASSAATTAAYAYSAAAYVPPVQSTLNTSASYEYSQSPWQPHGGIHGNDNDGDRSLNRAEPSPAAHLQSRLSQQWSYEEQHSVAAAPPPLPQTIPSQLQLQPSPRAQQQQQQDHGTGIFPGTPSHIHLPRAAAGSAGGGFAAVGGGSSTPGAAPGLETPSSGVGSRTPHHQTLSRVFSATTEASPRIPGSAGGGSDVSDVKKHLNF